MTPDNDVAHKRDIVLQSNYASSVTSYLLDTSKCMTSYLLGGRGYSDGFAWGRLSVPCEIISFLSSSYMLLYCICFAVVHARVGHGSACNKESVVGNHFAAISCDLH